MNGDKRAHKPHTQDMVHEIHHWSKHVECL